MKKIGKYIFLILSVIIFSTAYYYGEGSKNDFFFKMNGHISGNNNPGSGSFGVDKDQVFIKMRLWTSSEAGGMIELIAPDGKVYAQKGRNINYIKTVKSKPGIWRFTIKGSKYCEYRLGVYK